MTSLFPDISGDEGKPKTYQALWNALGRPNKVKFEYPRGHQLKLLEAIEKEFSNTSIHDIALSLPTGTGKTVIGLLFAYFTLLTKEVKAIYLCPNKFLCEQVLNEAKDLGIPAVPLYGSWKDIPETNKSVFLSGQAVGVATYSTLFNSNPQTGDIGAVIMDDIHAAGDSIISNWYIHINKEKNTQLYQQVVEIIDPVLNKRQRDALNTDPNNNEIFEMLYSKQWLNVVDDLRSVLDLNHAEKELKYVWKLCSPKIESFLCLLSYHTVELRPLTPPSYSIDVFRKARFRLYLSATIDKTGNLENIVGVEKIHWINQSDIDVPGNRLILNLNTLIPTVNDENRVTLIALKVKRLIVLAQSTAQQAILKSALELVGYKGRIHSPTKLDISAELNKFKTEKNAVIILAGRYDGIDLGAEAAEGILIYHLPEAINTLEHFQTLEWQTRDEARARAIQRIHQGMGRCTRKDSDEVMIFLVGEDLVKTLLDPQALNSFPGKLRQELQTCKSINQSSTLDQLIEEFRKKGPEWQKQKFTVSRKAHSSNVESESATSSDSERFMFVKYNDFIWVGRYDAAISLASSIAVKLSTGGHVADSAIWYYLSGLASDLKCFHEKSDPYKGSAHGYFEQSVSNSSTREWFGHLSAFLKRPEPLTDLKERIERIRSYLTRFPPENDSLEKELNNTIEDLDSGKDPRVKGFLRTLGEALGYEVTSPKRSGGPDCIWYINQEVHFIFEAKLDKSNNKITINEARQITSQPDEVRTDDELSVPNGFKATCLSDTNHIDRNASNTLDQFYVLRSTQVKHFSQTWFRNLVNIHRQAFKDYTYLESLIQDALIRLKLDTNGLRSKINAALAKSVLKEI